MFFKYICIYIGGKFQVISSSPGYPQQIFVTSCAGRPRPWRGLNPAIRLGGAADFRSRWKVLVEQRKWCWDVE